MDKKEKKIIQYGEIIESKICLIDIEKIKQSTTIHIIHTQILYRDIRISGFD